MAKIVSISNQKGGVGKTTTAVNFSAALGVHNCRVLLIDADPQGNSTSGYGINKRSIKNSIYEVIIGGADIRDALIQTNSDGVDILPSNINLAGAEIEIAGMEGREGTLRRVVAPIRDRYDVILIDCPPSLGLLTLNALCAADSVLVPVQCEYYALEGLSQLMNTIRQIRKLYNPSLTVEGVLLTMYDGRLNLTIQVVNEVKRFFPDKVYKTVIPRSVRLSEAPSHGQPIQTYDKLSKGAEAYRQMAVEFIMMNGISSKLEISGKTESKAGQA